MTDERQLYRSSDALVAGVCAGVADYFGLDPVVVRILVVVFTVASGGLLAVAYVAMWIVVPKAPEVAAPLDVEPQSAHSETYGSVDRDATPGANRQGAGRGAAAQPASWRYASPYAGAAHVPPEPPAAAWQQGTAAPTGFEANDDPSGFDASRPEPPFAPSTVPSYGGWSCGQGAGYVPKEPSQRSVRAALWAGSILLFFGIAALAAMFVEDISWWQYWPLIPVILGIVRMVIPSEAGCRMRRFVEGLICFATGSMLLPMSLGLVAWESLWAIAAGLWPLLLMMVGLFVLGSTLKSPVFTLLAGLCFLAFCVVGLLWYSTPGLTTEMVFMAPYGREYRFEMSPWIR